MQLESQITEAITFPADCCIFARFGSVPPFFVVVSILVCSGGSMFYHWSLVGAENRFDYG